MLKFTVRKAVRKGAKCWFIDANANAAARFDEPWFTRDDVEYLCARMNELVRVREGVQTFVLAVEAQQR
jgi:hypothetical protein